MRNNFYSNLRFSQDNQQQNSRFNTCKPYSILLTGHTNKGIFNIAQAGNHFQSNSSRSSKRKIINKHDRSFAVAGQTIFPGILEDTYLSS